jgi:hypothetical protein
VSVLIAKFGGKILVFSCSKLKFLIAGNMCSCLLEQAIGRNQSMVGLSFLMFIIT